MSTTRLTRPKRILKLPQNLKGFIILAEDDARNGNTLTIKQEPESRKPWAHNKSGFKCKKCTFKGKSRQDFENHMKIHKGTSFLCDECGIPLSSFQAFSEHLNIHKNLKPYMCETCGHESRQLSVHSRHLLVHERNPSRVFECSVCAKTFKQKTYLKQHMRKHIGEKPYECEKCSKSFTAKNELNRHKISHSSSRPFSCEKCGKKFKLKHNLQTHIRCHSGKQLWKCSLCKTSFPQQSLMEKHKKTHKEIVQHVELVKTDQRTLNITSFPLDRRKVRHHQRVSLPPKLDLNDSKNASNSTVSLGLSNTLIPISVIASSFGSGDCIKMKIIDPVNLATKNGTTLVPKMNEITNAVLVNEKLDITEGSKNYKQTHEADADLERGRRSKNNEGSFKNRFLTHFDAFEKTFAANSLQQADMVSWTETIVQIIGESQIPLENDISKKLHSVITQLQVVLLSSFGESDIESNANLCDPSCSTKGEIQNVESRGQVLSPRKSLESKVTESNANLRDPSCSTKEEIQKVESRGQVLSPRKSLESKVTETLQISKSFCEEKQIDYEQVTRRRLRKLFECYRKLSYVLQKHIEMTIAKGF